MGNLFAAPKTAEDYFRECELTLRTGIRRLERSCDDLSEQCELKRDQAKEAIRVNDKEECCSHIKQLIRYKNAKRRMTTLVGRMNEMLINIKLLKTTQEMQKAMLQVTRAMVMVNEGVNLRGMQQLIKEFEKQSMMMEDKQQQMEDTMDSSMAQFDDDDAQKELVQQVMEEIGLEMDLPDPFSQTTLDEELKKRLDNLAK
jgi:charged multivesicular body protein 2A